MGVKLVLLYQTIGSLCHHFSSILSVRQSFSSLRVPLSLLQLRHGQSQVTLAYTYFPPADT
jgi:hypothetical protein